MSSVQTTIDLYDVLNVPHDATKQAIKEAYGKLAKIYHPDKPTGNPELFELVTHAYNVLYNPSTRADYDVIFKLSKDCSIDHEVMKKKSKDYYKTLETSVAIKSKEESLKEFEEEMAKMKEEFKPIKIEAGEMRNMIDDMKLARDQDAIEFTPEMLFTDDKFDNVKFNEAFDRYFGHSNTAMTTYDDVNSYMDHKSIFGSDVDFMELDKNPMPRVNITKKHMKDIDTSNSKYNLKNEKLSEHDLNELVRQRKLELKNSMPASMSDYQTTVDKFGVFNNLGVSTNTIEWQNSKMDLQQKYNQLLENRAKIV